MFGLGCFSIGAPALSLFDDSCVPTRTGWISLFVMTPTATNPAVSLPEKAPPDVVESSELQEGNEVWMVRPLTPAAYERRYYVRQAAA
jgi:hypothetical protein